MVMGDAAAAQKWGLSDRSIRNYRARLDDDPELAALFYAKKAALMGAWGDAAGRFLGRALERLELLVAEADHPSYIGDIADAVKVVGELAIAKEVLGEPESDSQGPQPPTYQGAAKA